MSSSAVTRLVAVAARIAAPIDNFDEFVSGTVQGHVGLLKAVEDLDSVLNLMKRSEDNSGVATRLQSVKEKVEAALEVLRALDRMYSTGKLSFGDRAPRVDKPQKGKARSLELSQEKPGPGRPTRFK